MHLFEKDAAGKFIFSNESLSLMPYLVKCIRDANDRVDQLYQLLVVFNKCLVVAETKLRNTGTNERYKDDIDTIVRAVNIYDFIIKLMNVRDHVPKTLYLLYSLRDKLKYENDRLQTFQNCFQERFHFHLKHFDSNVLKVNVVSLLDIELNDEVKFMISKIDVVAIRSIDYSKYFGGFEISRLHELIESAKELEIGT